MRRARSRFWDEWLQNVDDLSGSNPREAARRTRLQFNGNGSRLPFDMNWADSSDQALHSGGVAASWRSHFSSSSVPENVEFDPNHFQQVTGLVNEIRTSAAQVSGSLDAPFSIGELVSALRGCHDGAVGIDGLPYEVFKVDFDWWQVRHHHGIFKWCRS